VFKLCFPKNPCPRVPLPILDVAPGVGEVAAAGLKSVGKIFTASRTGAKIIRAGLEVAEEAGAVARAIGNLAEEAAKKGAQRFEEIATPLKEKFGWCREMISPPFSWNWKTE
jgi:hypothetical protein